MVGDLRMSTKDIHCLLVCNVSSKESVNNALKHAMNSNKSLVWRLVAIS